VRDEDEKLGLSEPIWPERERPEDRERMSRVDLDLGPLVPVLDVFHGEVVEIQLSCNAVRSSGLGSTASTQIQSPSSRPATS
jgi:hypothetical protein